MEYFSYATCAISSACTYSLQKVTDVLSAPPARSYSPGDVEDWVKLNKQHAEYIAFEQLVSKKTGLEVTIISESKWSNAMFTCVEPAPVTKPLKSCIRKSTEREAGEQNGKKVRFSTATYTMVMSFKSLVQANMVKTSEITAFGNDVSDRTLVRPRRKPKGARLAELQQRLNAPLPELPNGFVYSTEHCDFSKSIIGIVN